jgi:phosphohistidine phosphatase
MRHAKSDWPLGVPDKERPLGSRGRSDAVEGGRWLAAQDFTCDLALVSPALRTTQTWNLVSGKLPEAPPVERPEVLYGASWSEMLELAQEIDDVHRVAVLVGHNPASGMLASALTGPGSDSEAESRVRTRYPTLGTAVLEFSGDWGQIEAGEGILRQFVAPRG